MKKDPIEDAHFRIDEHERKLESIGKALTPETVAALVQGAVAALQATTDAKLERILTAQTDDAAADKEVAAKISALIGKIDELIATLRSPITRTATISLPSGPANMTVRESR
jgi:hypothetical protein